MFGNKKKSLPPRPHPPLPEQILEDILSTDRNDVLFKTNSNDESMSVDNVLQQQQQQQQQSQQHQQSLNNCGETESVYKTLKSYLITREILNDLKDSLKIEKESLRINDEEMKKIAEDIRKQAQEALGNH